MAISQHFINILGGPEQADRFDRYMRVVNWAKRRYMEGANISLTMGGHPFRYALIEDMAGAKFLGCARHWPGLRLCDAIPHEGDPWPALRALEARTVA